MGKKKSGEPTESELKAMIENLVGQAREFLMRNMPGEVEKATKERAEQQQRQRAEQIQSRS